jgi:hypothetical protein
MVATLPLEILQLVSQQYPCRETQIESLAALYNVSSPTIFEHLHSSHGSAPLLRI